MARNWQREQKARGHPIVLAYKCSCIVYVFILYFTYGTLLIYNPLFYIDKFYVPALNKFINSTTAVDVIFFDLVIQNQMFNAGVRYDAVNLTFSYAGDENMTVGTYTVAGFYQGMEKTAQRRDVVIVNTSLPWKEAAMQALAGGSTAEFTVNVVSDVELRNIFWYFKEKRVTAEGRVEIDDLGMNVMKFVRLRPGEPDPSALLWCAGLLALLFVGFVLIFVSVFILHDFIVQNRRVNQLA